MRDNDASRFPDRALPSECADPRGVVSALLAEMVAPQPQTDLAVPWKNFLREGEVVGRFEILREVGRGGFGVVYEALDTALGRRVAIKALRPLRRRLDDVERERLRREAEAVARLEHPGIVTLFDAGTGPSGPYLVLELLRGEPLDIRLTRGRLVRREALRLAVEVARVLAHAHARSVLHRDLKPGNVFLTEDGRAKLLDFGFAHLLGSAGACPGGTPAYMAPEQARGETVDARADVFSLGVVLYESLQGRRPFEVREGRSAVLDGTAPRPMPARVPAPITSLVVRCLSPDPERRPRCGGALLEELLAVEHALKRERVVVKGAPVAPRPASGAASLAKIARPRLPPVFLRARLFHRLDEARSRRVVWVQGPPGAGKTTLVASYLGARRLRTLWYQMDEGDAEVGTFFHYLGVAAQELAPRQSPPPPLGAEQARSLTAFTRWWFRDLYARLAPRFALVLDNYHAVPADARFHQVVREALEELPPGGNAILVSRTEPVPALARLRASGAMSVVAGDELRLTLAESRGIARLRARKGFACSEVDRLHHRIQGWAAGLVLLLESSRPGESRPAAEEEPQAVFDYFAGEIFERADGDAQKMLLETALLPRFTAAMAERLTGAEGAGRMLDDLARRGYFTTRSGEQEAHYQFHPLFRDFLLARGRRSLPPERLSGLRVRAARVLRDAGDAEEAVALYRQTESWEELADLVLLQARDLQRTGRTETLERWIASMPAPVRDRIPWLHYWLGMARLSMDAASFRTHFERSFELLSAQGDAAGAYLSFAAATAYSLVELWTDVSDLVRLDGWIERFEQLRRRFPSGQSAGIETRASSGFLAALLVRRPQHPEYQEWHDRVFRLALGDARPDARLVAGEILSHALILKGEFPESRALLAALAPLARQGDVAPSNAISWLSAEALNYWSAGAWDSALRAVREARRIAEDLTLHGLDLLLDLQEAFAWIVGEVPAPAEAALCRVEAALGPARRLDTPVFGLASGHLGLRRQQFGRALEHAGALVAAGRQSGLPAFAVFGHLLSALALGRGGERGAVPAHLAAARQVGAAAGIPLADYLSSLAESSLALAAGDRTGASEGLRRALSLGRGHSFVHHLWFSRAEIAELYTLALGLRMDPGRLGSRGP